ncbi:MAG: hypothetical protein Q9167_001180 [Letrouitia subvulpina]
MRKPTNFSNSQAILLSLLYCNTVASRQLHPGPVNYSRDASLAEEKAEQAGWKAYWQYGNLSPMPTEDSGPHTLLPANPRDIESLDNHGDWIILSYEPTDLVNDTELDSLHNVKTWLLTESVQTRIPREEVEGTAICLVDGTNCSSTTMCSQVYNTIFTGPWSSISVSDDNKFWFFIIDHFYQDLNGSYSPLNAVNCPLSLFNDSIPVEHPLFDCSQGIFELSADNYIYSDVDTNLQSLIHGGGDTDGVWWAPMGEHNSSAGPKPGDPSFSEELGFRLIDVPAFVCSLQLPCQAQFSCVDVGYRGTLDQSPSFIQLPWAYLALSSFAHLYQQLSNQYAALTSAATKVTQTTFNIDDFYPTPNNGFGLLNLLTGLGTLFAVAAGLVPVAGTIAGTVAIASQAAAGAAGGASAIIPAVGSYYGRFIAQSQLANLPQKEFAPLLQAVYTVFEDALQNLTTTLFRGDPIDGPNGSFDITDVIKNGSWVATDAVAPLLDIEEQLRLEILCRSINALWLQPPHNKMWVLYVDLQEKPNDNRSCVADKSGPQDLKYCANGGVYYAYNFVETGDERGQLRFPWGAQNLPSLNIGMSVRLTLFILASQHKLTANIQWPTEASAKSYRLLKKKDSDPFNFSNPDLAYQILSQAVSDSGIDLANLAGKNAGSWTMPAGRETKDWVRAAGMLNFDTYYERCKRALLDSSFVWPENAIEVDFGFGETIKRPASAKVVSPITNTSANLGPSPQPLSPFVVYDEASSICWQSLTNTVCLPAGDYDFNARDWDFEFKKAENVTGPPGASVVLHFPGQDVTYPVPATYAQIFTAPPQGVGIWQVSIISMQMTQPPIAGFCGFQWPNYNGGMLCLKAPGAGEVNGVSRGHIESVRLIGGTALQIWSDRYGGEDIKYLTEDAPDVRAVSPNGESKFDGDIVALSVFQRPSK